MSENSAIEWTDATWNPIRGQNARHTCARISPGCDNCYAATMTRRGLMGTAPLDYGTGETPNDPARLDEAALMQPLKWRKPRKIFVCSMTDLFGTWVPDEWIDRIFAVMALAPRHTFIVLTKRPTRMRDYLLKGPWGSSLVAARKHTTALVDLIRAYAEASDDPEAYIEAGDFAARWPLPNVWLGTTIESNQFAWRADRLRQTPAAVRWISAEPLLSGLPSLDLTGIDWLVAGGESGPKARPMHPDWPRDLRDRCQSAGVAFFFKQWGAWTPDRSGQIQVSRNCWRYKSQTFTPDGVQYEASKPDMMMLPGMTTLYRKGNHETGRELDGREWNQFPESKAAVS